MTLGISCAISTLRVTPGAVATLLGIAAIVHANVLVPGPARWTLNEPASK